MLTVETQAFAKINLFLHIIGQRPDGYHLLQSVFVGIDWCDQIRIERREDGSIQRYDIGMKLPTVDLCLKAAHCLQEVSQTQYGADIFVDKHIPVGAGMGGGSSDAAHVLLALNKLWNLHWPIEKLNPLALALGADVPFFLQARHAWVEGVGEKITPVLLPPELLKARLAVLMPPVSVATQKIFSSPDLPRNTPCVTSTEFFANPAYFGQNDMQAVVCRVAPEVLQALKVLDHLFGPSRMTGSGAAVFAWVPPHLSFDEAQVILQKCLPTSDWLGRICHLLPS